MQEGLTMPSLIRGGHHYYYRKHRVGKKVFTEYVGTGPKAELEASLDLMQRARKQAERKAKKAEEDRLQALQDQVLAFIGLADLVSKMCLVAGGYRQHRRGVWCRLQLKKQDRGQLVAGPSNREGKQ
jgi:hypothetical protein